MSQKRKHADVADGGRGGPNFKKQRPFKPAGPGQKKYGPKHGKKASHGDEPKADSTGSLKSRIRNLTRLLEHVGNDAMNKMPATVRNERERELEACKHELTEKLAADREAEFRNKIIGKYHHIRFFERQKATRTVKRLTKQLSTVEDNSERAALRSRIHNANVDVNYTTYYPLLRPYVSLFPKAKKDQSTPAESTEESSTRDRPGAEAVDGPRGDVEMWKAVEDAMEAGTLEKLRNSKEGVTIPGPKEAVSKSAQGKKATLVQCGPREQAAPKEEDEDSDGGFFE
ncbi:hypothetical protein K458DRAFT_373644 [Lentithecium fluviatile CBS 122367]|uniref:rRNA-processing protein EFG1 n=1 Tax=Lentithecium fluviatile CBS 122367 TaxID=1168545 RepID=A0A6G1IQJ2_9PLEO|nr:hypothetical protein K458DRAFT_373644 [Lentithecium fluviatile CBS 122367]